MASNSTKPNATPASGCLSLGTSSSKLKHRNSGPCPSARFECCARQQPGQGGKSTPEAVPGLLRGPKTKPPHPTESFSGAIVTSQPWIQLSVKMWLVPVSLGQISASLGQISTVFSLIAPTVLKARTDARSGCHHIVHRYHSPESQN